MRNLILLTLSTLLYTGCSYEIPSRVNIDLTNTQADYIADKLLYSNDGEVNTKITQATYKALNQINQYLKLEAKECSRIGKCLGKPTYLFLDPEYLYKTQCLSVSNNKKVSCD